MDPGLEAIARGFIPLAHGAPRQPEPGLSWSRFGDGSKAPGDGFEPGGVEAGSAPLPGAGGSFHFRFLQSLAASTPVGRWLSSFPQTGKPRRPAGDQGSAMSDGPRREPQPP